MNFTPDYHNLLDAARNKEARRVPLYEHIISSKIMEQVLNYSFADLIHGDDRDLQEYFRAFCKFFVEMGYDTVSFEALISEIMPGNGCLYGHKEGIIKDREDFERYPWDEIPSYFIQKHKRSFDALRGQIPPGMKAVGGAGNGVFECVQDIVGFTDLCYIKADDPELYADLFRKVGETNLKIWKWVISQYSDIFCAFRFGDDLGFKLATLLPPDDIRQLIIPQYKNIIDCVHAVGKPFIFHSCGCIFDVMDDLIRAGIDVKHSNEDVIAPFTTWVQEYGERIGNFGGADVDAVCKLNRDNLREYIVDILDHSKNHGGIAFGTGNSIPDYMPVEGYLNMVELVREYRGDYKK